MAATITSLALANYGSVSTTTTLVTNAAVTAQSGDWLVAIAVAENVGANGAGSGFSSITNAAGNVTWTTRVDTYYDPADVGDGTGLVFATGQVTGTITNDTVTVTYSDGIFQGALRVYRFRPGSGESVSFIGSGSAGGSNTTSHSASTASVTNGDTIFCAAGIETDDTVTGDSDTTNGSWSALDQITATAGGGDLGAQVNANQYKTVTATGNQSWTCTTAVARDSKTGHIILRSSVVGFTIDAGVGSYALTGTNASTLHAWKVAAAAGSYSLTGTNAALKHAWKIAAGAGSYVLTGTNATLTKGFGSKTLAAGIGSYAITGTAATPKHAWKVAASVGSYTMTGTSASTVKSVSPAGMSADGRPTVERTGEGYSEENAKDSRRNRWEAEQFRKKLDAMYDGREYVEQPFPEDVPPVDPAIAAAQAAAERQAQFQAMLIEQQQRQRDARIAQMFAMRQAQDEEDAATIAVMGD
jgi:hypothetical protein